MSEGALNVAAVSGPADANLKTGNLAGDVAGEVAVTEASTLSAVGDGGGTIRIEGGRLVVDQASSVVSTNTGLTDGEVGIDIDADMVEVTDGSSISTFAQSGGKGGDINVEASKLEVARGTNINSETSGAGNGGDVVLAGETIDIRDESRVSSFTSASGDSGKIDIEAADLTVQGGSDLVTLTNEVSAGQGGDIIVAADTIDVLAGEEGEPSSITTGTLGSGDAGNIDIRASRVFADGNSRRNGAAIQTTSTNPDSLGGQIRLDVGRLTLVRGGLVFAEPSGGSDGQPTIDITADSISIDGASSDLTGISLFAIAVGDESGAIAVRARDLDIQNGGVITTSTGSDVDSGDILIVVDRLSLDDQAEGPIATNISTDTVGTGDAGQLVIRADSIDLSGRSFISSATLGDGNAGVVEITASSSIRLQDRSTISTSTSTTGDAGSILIETADLDLIDGGDVAAVTTDVGDGGTIRIKADDILIDNRRSENTGGILAQGTPGSSGDAGDIEVTSDRLTVLNEAQISSAAFGDGNAGDIVINAGNVEINDGGGQPNFVTSITSFVEEGGIGEGGNISITADRLLLQGDTARILADNLGSGTAGSIDLDLSDSLVIVGGAINTASANAGGGIITIEADDFIEAERVAVKSSPRFSKMTAMPVTSLSKHHSLRLVTPMSWREPMLARAVTFKSRLMISCCPLMPISTQQPATPVLMARLPSQRRKWI